MLRRGSQDSKCSPTALCHLMAATRCFLGTLRTTPVTHTRMHPHRWEGGKPGHSGGSLLKLPGQLESNPSTQERQKPYVFLNSVQTINQTLGVSTTHPFSAKLELVISVKCGEWRFEVLICRDHTSSVGCIGYKVQPATWASGLVIQQPFKLIPPSLRLMHGSGHLAEVASLLCSSTHTNILVRLATERRGGWRGQRSPSAGGMFH